VSLQRLAKEDLKDPIGQAVDQLVKDLVDLKEVFAKSSEEMDDQTLPYHVMDPGSIAISILL